MGDDMAHYSLLWRARNHLFAEHDFDMTQVGSMFPPEIEEQHTHDHEHREVGHTHESTSSIFTW